MHNKVCEYLINVASPPPDSLIQERAYSYEEAINRANGLSLLYPQSDIVIEEWTLVTSDEIFVSGLYKGATTIIRATGKEANVA